MALSDLNTLINATAPNGSTTQNLSSFKGLTAAYQYLGFGVPTIDGYTNLINNNNATNFGAGGNFVFNDENVYINSFASLYRFNADAKAAFDAIVGGGATNSDKLGLVYDSIVPLSAQSAAGKAYFVSQANFYSQRAAELGITGPNAGAVVAAAALSKIVVDSDIGGLGDSINDLRAAVADGSAAIPQSGAAFTPIETADGTKFDGDDVTQQGASLVLTSKVDVVNGGSSNDTVIAGLDGGNPTINAGDSINGGGGTDRLNIFGNANAAAFGTATITSVEQVYAQLASAGASALDVSGNAGVQVVGFANGTTGGNEIKLTTAQTAALEGKVGSTAQFNYTNAAGPADSVALVANGASVDAGGVTSLVGVETVKITATGTNDLGFLVGSQTSITAAGGGSLKFTAVSPLKSLDASALTGALNANLTPVGAQDLTVKGGSANDTITTVFANQTSADSIDLGVGTNDTLLFTDAVSILNATDAAKLSKVVGVEELGTVGATLTLDGDLVSQTRFSTSGAGSFNIVDAAQSSTVEFGAGAAAASQVALKLGASILNVDLQGSATAAADASASLFVQGSSTINVSSTGTAGIADNNITLIVADNQSINLTGSQNTTLTYANFPGGTGSNIDGSSFTGKLNIIGASAASDIIKGGSAADIINGGAGADTMTGNAGGDTFFVITNPTADTAAAIQASADTITDFVTKSDKIEFGAAAGSATNYKEGAAAVADFAAALAAADAQLDGTVKYSAQQVGSDTYVFFDDNGTVTGETNTHVVKLTGVTLAGIEAADII
ncbi:serralysin precursor [Variibacter gotjawalensis]|uniref:Serralysin n=1 Tax=Variibacter gotjawalensis TaxID=1333996 RepID=A0A0S3PNP9_9BRAD|nr:hypothetical protein [Variibacter gotjawalensis]NIK47861.1 hypothetical protein [Variibacter gotjawalensis]RZS49747.1 hypothetical protein EV661_2187 [Variibacter gotjawalensis]BAT57575.1 serralysin precursor [Variibacter gotjawalensis]